MGVLDDFTVLNVETTDFGEGTVGGVVSGDELSDDGEFLARVDGFADTEEGLVTHAPGVEIATVLVADTVVSCVVVTAVGAGATSLTVDCARVGSVGSGVGVGFPDIHLCAAGTVLTLSCVGVVGITSPTHDVGLL